MPGTWLNTVHASAPREPPSTNAFRNIYALLSRENCIDLGQIRRELDGLRLRDAAPRAVQRHADAVHRVRDEFDPNKCNFPGRAMHKYSGKRSLTGVL